MKKTVRYKKKMANCAIIMGKTHEYEKDEFPMAIVTGGLAEADRIGRHLETKTRHGQPLIFTRTFLQVPVYACESNIPNDKELL